MRRRTVFLVAVLAVATACSSSDPVRPAGDVARAGVRKPSASPPSTSTFLRTSRMFRASPPSTSTSPPSTSTSPPSTSTSPYVSRTPPPPTPLLPQPVPIPADSYASEPVVEIGTMEIPAIGLRHRLFQGVTLHNIDTGPSHWTGTAMPGEVGNAVIAGHRATHGEPFRRIDELAAGDEVLFTVGGQRSAYRVTDSLVVEPADSWIANQTSAPTATLYACHPVGSTAQRYVVRLELTA